MSSEEKILSMLETLITKQQKTNDQLENVERKVENIEKEIQTVKNTIIIIENEHGKKLDALFDGYSQLYDISKETRKDVIDLRSSQEKQDLHIKWLNSFKRAE